MYYIGGVGPKTAKLAIVAEKPGQDELNYLIKNGPGSGMPLIGPSGKQLNQLLINIGTRREDVYVTNAVKHFDKLGNPTDQDIKDQQVELFQELSSLPNLNCIVALGNAALLSLSNFHFAEIRKRRGSIITSYIGKKMVPTIHPAAYMHKDWKTRSVVQFDLSRALEESETPDIKLPERYFYVEPTFDEAIDWLINLEGSEYISFDIETSRPSYIRCIAFSNDPKFAYCIPIMRSNRSSYWTPSQESVIWQLIQKLLSNPKTTYVTQNGMFDVFILWKHGIVCPYMNKAFDTMYAHKTLAADLEHTLAFIVSIYTREPYYKDESGSWKEDKKAGTSQLKVPDVDFWVYNCKDAACTLEASFALKEDLIKERLYDYYRENVQTQFDVLFQMQVDGIKVDKKALYSMRQTLNSEISIFNSKLESELGFIPNTKSKKDFERIFTHFGIRPTYTPKGNAKAGNENLLTYAYNWPASRDCIFNTIEVTERRTLLSNFLGMYLDPDDRYHPYYNLHGTKSERLSSKGDESGGPQIQNIPPNCRHLFIPDSPDHVFLWADLKQAELMFVAYYSGDPLLIEAFKRGIDVHRVRGCVIYRDWDKEELPPPDLLASIEDICPKCKIEYPGMKKCSHSERFMAKTCGHAFSYLMGIYRLMQTLREVNVFIDMKTAEHIKNRVVSKHISNWHEAVYYCLKESPWLDHPFGKRKEFFGILEKYPESKLLKEALSWLCQFGVSYITNRAMRYIHEKTRVNSFLRTQTHDSVGISCHVSAIEETKQICEEAFHTPVTIGSETFLIPLEFEIGNSWGQLVDYDKFMNGLKHGFAFMD